MRSHIVSWLHEIIRRLFYLLVWPRIILLLLTVLLLNGLELLLGQPCSLHGSLLHFFPLTCIFITVRIIELMFIVVSILNILLLHSLILTELICHLRIFWELFYNFVISNVLIIHSIVLLILIILVQLYWFLLIWVFELFKKLLLSTHLIFKIL